MTAAVAFIAGALFATAVYAFLLWRYVKHYEWSAKHWDWRVGAWVRDKP